MKLPQKVFTFLLLATVLFGCSDASGYCKRECKVIGEDYFGEPKWQCSPEKCYQIKEETTDGN